jgi:hypothetical protein
MAEPNQNSKFDADEAKRAAKALADLKRSNLKGVFGAGAGRVAIIVVGGVMTAMVFFGLYNLLSAPKRVVQQANASNAVLGGAVRGGDPEAANPAEARQRAEQNDREAQAAAAAGRPYMAPPVLVASTPAAQLGANGFTPASGAPGTSAAAVPTSTQQGQEGAPLRVPVSYRAVASTLGASEVLSQVIAVARGQDPTQQNHSARYSIGYYPVSTAVSPGAGRNQQPAQQLAMNSGGAAVSSSGAAVIKRPIAGMSAGTAAYCQFFFGMNSDLPRKDAVAKCYGGVFDGATFLGKAEASTEGVAEPGFTVTFDKLSLPGHAVIDVNAIAVDVATKEESVADSVDSHSGVKFSELALAGLLKGIGQATSQQQANSTTQTVGNVSTTIVGTLRPDITQIVGGALGGVGNGVGDFFQKKSDALKTTIKVYSGKDIGVVLLGDVTE